MLPDFTGENQDVEFWIERIDSVQSVYYVSDSIMQLVAIGKMQGTAKKWYLSRVDYVTMPWNVLKNEMRKFFTSRPNRVTFRKSFESRTQNAKTRKVCRQG